MDDDWGYPYFRNPQIKFNCEKMLGVKQELLGTSRGFDHENHPKNQAVDQFQCRFLGIRIRMKYINICPKKIPRVPWISPWEKSTNLRRRSRNIDPKAKSSGKKWYIQMLASAGLPNQSKSVVSSKTGKSHETS